MLLNPEQHAELPTASNYLCPPVLVMQGLATTSEGQGMSFSLRTHARPSGTQKEQQKQATICMEKVIFIMWLSSALRDQWSRVVEEENRICKGCFGQGGVLIAWCASLLVGWMTSLGWYHKGPQWCSQDSEISRSESVHWPGSYLVHAFME